MDFSNPGHVIVFLVAAGLFWLVSSEKGQRAVRSIGLGFWQVAARMKVEMMIPRIREVPNMARPPTALDALLYPAIAPRTVINGGAALLHTPNAIDLTVAYMRHEHAALFPNEKPSFLLPLGWYVYAGKPRLAWTRLVKDAYWLLVSGMSRSGKDNYLFSALTALLAQHTPEELEVWVIDGKGLDWKVFEGRAHFRMICTDAEDIPAAMKAVTAERDRRKLLIQKYSAAGVRNWTRLPANDKPALMVLVVTELTLLFDTHGKNETEMWLNTTLSALAAFGGCGLIQTQNASNMSTNWRGQIGLYLAAAQAKPSADEPNAVFSAKQLRAMGVVPPSELPAVPDNAGVFALVSTGQRKAINVRAGYIDDAPLADFVRTLPPGNQLPLGGGSAAPTPVDTEPPADVRHRTPMPLEDFDMPLLSSAAEASDRMLREALESLPGVPVNTAQPTSDETGAQPSVVDQAPGRSMTIPARMYYIVRRRTEQRDYSKSDAETELYGIMRGGSQYRAVDMAWNLADAFIAGDTTTTTTTPGKEPKDA